MRKFIGVLVLTAVTFVWQVVPASGQVPDAWLGVWKVNVAKSTYSPGPPPKSSVVTWEALSDGRYRITTETVNANGVTSKIESVTRLDGTEEPLAESNPVQGRTRTRIYKRINDSSYEFVTKANGKIVTTTRAVYAADGRTRTLTTSGTRLDGQSVKDVVSYEKQ
jgi:hypothetical protein